MKAPRHARFGLLNPLQVRYAAWGSTSVDFITQLPKSAGYTQIMVVVDLFTKMAHFIGLEEKATARDVAESFLKEVWKLHGLPSEIISDMMRSLPKNFRNHCAKNSASNEKCQLRTTLNLMDKRNELTKCWEATSVYLSTPIRTTGIISYA